MTRFQDAIQLELDRMKVSLISAKEIEDDFRAAFGLEEAVLLLHRDIIRHIVRAMVENKEKLKREKEHISYEL